VFTHPDTLAKITSALRKFSKMADDADRAILRLDTIIVQNKKDVGSTIENVNKISTSILETTSTLEKTMARIDQLVQSDSIGDIIGNTREISQKLKETNITQLIDDLAGVVRRTKDLLIKVDDDINKGSKGLVETQELLQSTLRNLEEASRKINNNPSVLIRKSKVKNLPDDKLKD
jgi:phospholipid/cholesterol/gamma-HCH transport system substrate-binding protein